MTRPTAEPSGLLPCPFCFADVEVMRQTSKVPDRWVVECEVCGARCGESPSSNAARTNWNQREACPAGSEASTDYECPECGKLNYMPLCCQNCGHDPTPTPSEPGGEEYQDGISAGQAVATLSSCFASDPGFAWGWHCNLAMAAQDEGLDHVAANRAAARFMYAAFGIDTTKCDEYAAFLKHRGRA